VLSIARVSTGPASVRGARSAARAQVSHPTASWQTSNAEHHRRRRGWSERSRDLIERRYGTNDRLKYQGVSQRLVIAPELRRPFAWTISGKNERRF
jgi:hypothetical protein